MPQFPQRNNSFRDLPCLEIRSRLPKRLNEHLQRGQDLGQAYGAEQKACTASIRERSAWHKRRPSILGKQVGMDGCRGLSKALGPSLESYLTQLNLVMNKQVRYLGDPSPCHPLPLPFTMTPLCLLPSRVILAWTTLPTPPAAPSESYCTSIAPAFCTQTPHCMLSAYPGTVLSAGSDAERQNRISS